MLRAFRTALSITTLAAFSLAASALDTNWTDYRGNTTDGFTKAAGLPTIWSETQNVRWKTPIDGRAWSSPIIWDNTIWLTNADKDGHQMSVLAINKETGKIRINRPLITNATPEPINDFNSYASPTPAVDKDRVYLHFGTYGTVCLDQKTGNTLWERRDIHCKHSVGPGSSPVLYGNALILTFDGIDVQYLIALNKTTGKTLWKSDRGIEWKGLHAEMRKAYHTPTFTTVDGQTQMISTAAMAACAYDPRTGSEIWRIRHGGYSGSARTLVGDGMAYLFTGYNRSDLIAVKLGGRGDVTDTHIAWKFSRNMPFKPSPLLIDGLLYIISDGGFLTCLDAKTGAEIWKERVGGNFSASPIYAEGRIYLFNEEGKTTLVKPGRTYQKIGECELGDGFMASPAVSGKALFVRTKSALYRIETK